VNDETSGDEDDETREVCITGFGERWKDVTF
jgi:hypothetical protein